MMIVYVDDFLVTCAQDYDKTELTDLFEWGSQKELLLSEPLDFKGKEFTLQKKGKDFVLKVTQSKFLNTTPSPDTKILRGRHEEPLTAQDRSEFKSVTGSLRWLASQSRPELAAWVSQSWQREHHQGAVPTLQGPELRA